MITILGKGHLGRYLAKNLPDAYLWHGNDIADYRITQENCPHLLVNAAGKTDLSFCESNQAEAFRCNAIAPLMLFRECQKYQVRFIHISSGCLWDDPSGKPFEPDAPIMPACFYSWTKAAAEAFLLRESKGGLLTILRPRQLYSGENSPRNTLTKLLRYPSLLQTPNSMTSCRTVAKAILKSQQHPIQLMNVYDRGVTSPYAVGMLLYEAGLREKPSLIQKTDLDVWHKPRRVDCVLHDELFEQRVQPPYVEDELRESIAELKKNLI